LINTDQSTEGNDHHDDDHRTRRRLRHDPPRTAQVPAQRCIGSRPSKRDTASLRKKFDAWTAAKVKVNEEVSEEISD
jgi:hypothetical protein